MRYPTQSPPPAPTITANSIGGIATTNNFNPAPIAIITAAKMTTVTARQKKTTAGLMGDRSRGVSPQESTAVPYRKEAA